MARPGDYVTLVLKRTDVSVIVSALGTEAERWRKRAHTFKPNGEPWSNAVKQASQTLEVKAHVLKNVQKQVEVDQHGRITITA